MFCVMREPIMDVHLSASVCGMQPLLFERGGLAGVGLGNTGSVDSGGT